jgi:hypothetical protein
VNLAKLFLLSILLAGAGSALGGAAGMGIGRGWLILGGFIVGGIFVVLGGFLGTRLHWIQPSQRLWSILGAVFGFAFAWMVALATLRVPGVLYASTLLVGIGAVLGAVIGISPHAKS